jgi:hypothetical protein
MQHEQHSRKNLAFYIFELNDKEVRMTSCYQSFGHAWIYRKEGADVTDVGRLRHE